MTDPTALVDARGVLKRYGPTQVLNGVDFAVRPGEVHALLGGNGAGKSTLIKIITGAVRADGGELRIEGQVHASAHEYEAQAARVIAVVHQETALLPHLTVAENIALPRHRRATGHFRLTRAIETAHEALAVIDPEFATRAVERPVHALSLHERQLVEIARTLSSGARLLLLDEPTANLTSGETDRLFDLLRRLIQQRGIGVVFVSHRMREIRRIADVCTIIRNGRAAVHRAPMASLTDAEIVEQMGQAAKAPATSRGERSAAPSATLYTLSSGAISLQIRRGEVVGLAGAPAGPSALIDQIVGAAPGGTWTFADAQLRPLQHRTPAQAARAGIGFVSGDRANKGVLAALPIVDNLMASRRVVRRQQRVPASETADGEGLLRSLSVKAASLWHLPNTLSGGTQQKLLVARWTQLAPRVLVLEEPTRGVDIGTKREIYAQIRAMAEQGTTVIWWSTEATELVAVCDVVLTFDPDGTPTGVLRHDAITEERLAEATGMAA